jgi:hypothetical protein
MVTNYIDLTFAQISAIHSKHYEIGSHKKITIEQTHTKYTHTYIYIAKDCYHVAKNGKITGPLAEDSSL